MNSRVIQNLEEALNTVDRFMIEGKRILQSHLKDEAGDTDEYVIGLIQSKMAWGLANASSCIQNAIMAAAEARTREARNT